MKTLIILQLFFFSSAWGVEDPCERQTARTRELINEFHSLQSENRDLLGDPHETNAEQLLANSNTSNPFESANDQLQNNRPERPISTLYDPEPSNPDPNSIDNLYDPPRSHARTQYDERQTAFENASSRLNTMRSEFSSLRETCNQLRSERNISEGSSSSRSSVGSSVNDILGPAIGIAAAVPAALAGIPGPMIGAIVGGARSSAGTAGATGTPDPYAYPHRNDLPAATPGPQLPPPRITLNPEEDEQKLGQPRPPLTPQQIYRQQHDNAVARQEDLRARANPAVSQSLSNRDYEQARSQMQDMGISRERASAIISGERMSNFQNAMNAPSSPAATIAAERLSNPLASLSTPETPKPPPPARPSAVVNNNVDPFDMSMSRTPVAVTSSTPATGLVRNGQNQDALRINGAVFNPTITSRMGSDNSPVQYFGSTENPERYRMEASGVLYERGANGSYSQIGNVRNGSFTGTQPVSASAPSAGGGGRYCTSAGCFSVPSSGTSSGSTTVRRRR